MQSRFYQFLSSLEKRVFLVIDKHVQEIYQFSADKMVTISGGESVKTRKMKEFVEDELLKQGIGRGDIIVAVGGGSVTDLVGFVAATLHRGVDYVNVPTTFLGMVDASIGGKTGINTPFGKNTIGAFHLPKQIYIEEEFLTTLSKVDYLMGLAEVIKYGLIFDRNLFEELERGDFDTKKVIERSQQIKQEIVEKDPREIGLRQILNFGHTVAHGLELISHYQIPHGFAVATGLLMETKLSVQQGFCSYEEFFRLKELLERYEFPLQSFCKELLYSAMLLDKKNKDGKVYFVLLDRIGRCVEKEGRYSFPISKEILSNIL
jgi:3-dehydroquinate synthase